MVTAIICVVILWCIYRWIAGICDGSSRENQSITRELLIEEARAKYPNEDLCAALDHLYADKIRQIKIYNYQNLDTTEIQDELYIILNERSRLISEEEPQIKILLSQKSI